MRASFKTWGKHAAVAVLLILAACSKETSPRAGETALDPNEQLLRDAVLQVGGVSAEASRSSDLCALAYPHLNYMADHGQISHDGYPSRSQTIEEEGGSNTGEIVAYNSGRSSAAEQAAGCAKSWRNSPEHWRLMSKRWNYACYAMLTSQNRTYCIGLFANGNLK